MVENAHLDFSWPFLKNVWIIILTTLDGYVNLFVKGDVIKNDFNQLFGCSELRNVPDAFGHLYVGVFVENEAFESCSGVVDVVSWPRKSKKYFFGNCPFDFLLTDNCSGCQGKHLFHGIVLFLNFLLIANGNKLNIFPDMGVLFFVFGCNIALLLFDCMKELKTDTEFGFKLQDVKGFVFSLEFLKLF